MRVAVVGASGRCGRAVVEHAIEAGHEVISVVRNPASAPADTRAVQADARDGKALGVAIGGADAVLSCLGHVAADADHTTLLREGATALVGAMGVTGVTRLVIVSASGAYVGGDDPLSRFVAKPILGRLLKENFVDTRAMEDVVRASSTEWTILRPSRLVRGVGRPDYRRRLDLSVRWHYDTRFDTVGRAAADALGTPGWIGHAVSITG